MNLRELENRAEEIEHAGDWITTNALNRGKNGVGKFYPSDKARIDAYRTGLNLFFQSNDLKDYIVAEEVVTGDISLQQGFFDRFRIPSSIFPSKEGEYTRQMYFDNYQRNLKQIQGLQNAGVDVGYSSYLRGALIAIRVQSAVMKESVEKLSNIVNSPTVPEDNYQEDSHTEENNPQQMLRINFDKLREDIKDAENRLQSMIQEKAILEMALKDPASHIDLSFSPEEIKRLHLLKKLRREGKI